MAKQKTTFQHTAAIAVKKMGLAITELTEQERGGGWGGRVCGGLPEVAKGAERV